MNNLYAVFDSCSCVFGDPIISDNDSSAKRFFRYSLSDKNLPDFIRKDSVLYGVGYFDRETGLITSDGLPYIVDRGCNVVVADVVDCEVSTGEK